MPRQACREPASAGRSFDYAGKIRVRVESRLSFRVAGKVLEAVSIPAPWFARGRCSRESVRATCAWAMIVATALTLLFFAAGHVRRLVRGPPPAGKLAGFQSVARKSPRRVAQ